MHKRKRIATLLLALLIAAVIMPKAVASELTEEEQMEQLLTGLFGSFHMVVLTEDFTGDTLAADGLDYTFEVIDDGYDYQILAYMGGEAVTAVDNGDGTFTIRNVTAPLVIGCRKTAKLPQVPVESPAMNSGTTVKPQIPTVQPAADPEVPAEEQAVQEQTPEIIPDEAVVETENTVPEPVEEPIAQAAPVSVEVVEKEPFPWWIVAAAVAALAGITVLVFLLNRRTVTFVVEGGSNVQAQKVLKGRMASRPVEPEKDGAVFAGWFRDEARTQRWDFENARVQGHLTLYAKWLAVR